MELLQGVTSTRRRRSTSIMTLNNSQTHITFQRSSLYPSRKIVPAFTSTLLCRPITTSVASTTATTILSKGQFAKRIRVPQLLGGIHIPQPQHPKNGSYSRTTPSASLFTSISSLASTGAGIFLLGFIICIHESGHFLAARWQGIRVKNFSIGFGPKLATYSPKDSETEFTLRLLPLGGYVAFPEHSKVDEETGEEIIDTDKDLLQNRPILDRALVISAGVIANIILAWASIFTSVSAVGLPTYSFNPGVTISNVVDTNGAAAMAGIRNGDVILKLDGKEVAQSLSNANTVAEKIRTSGGRAIDFRIAREGSEFNIRIRPKCCTPDGNAAMGVQLVPNAVVTRQKPPTLKSAFITTNKEFFRLSKQTWNGLCSIFLNFGSSSQQLSGPIGVVSMGADLARNDSAALLTFCAVISINLALINSLPLPALDGGQMTFLIVEALRGSPISLRIQDAINRTALLLFLAFSGVLVFGDLEKLNLVVAIKKLFG